MQKSVTNLRAHHYNIASRLEVTKEAYSIFYLTDYQFEFR